MDKAARAALLTAKGIKSNRAAYALGGIEDMSREEFLGNPKITSNKNASDLQPRALPALDNVQHEDFPIGGLTAKYHPDGAAIFDDGKTIASYNLGKTLVVNPKYRRKGIAKELVYQWRSRYPESAATEYRTKASQAIQEAVWDRVQQEKANRIGKSAGGAMDFARHVEAVNRAGGQIAPSKYLPNVPRQVHADGGKVAFMQDNHPLVPDVLYHGTARDIKSFDPDAKRSYDVDPSNPEETDTGWFGKGHYFTASPKLAAHYADEGAKRQGGQGASIIPAHVAMKNPFVVDMKAYDSGAKTLDNALSRAGVPMHPRGYRMPSEQTAALVGMGHDGVIATREGKPEEYVAFHPTQIKSAIGNQGTFDPNDPDITKAGGGSVDFTRDNPGGDWLAKKQSYAFEYPRMKGIDGAITGWMGGKSDLFLPTHVLKSIEPLNNEKRVAGEPRFDDLMSSVSKEGFDPHQKGNKVVVAVNHHGKPFILEGNTRVAVAHAMGVPSVKAEVRYWNGAEEADGPMHPDKVSAMAAPNDPDMTKAGGGEVDGEDDGITAYHGSPHSFDKFDISKLGTGEGAQAYGHGLYFAGNEGIAKSYRDKLSMGASSIDGRPMADIADEKHKLPYGQNPTIEHNIADIVSSYGDNARPVMQKRYPELLSAYDNMVSNGRISSGHMYKVKLNVKPHELLDWDKPLSEQPHVLNAIGNRYGDPEIVMQQLGNDVNTATGRDLHDALSGMGQDKQLAAKNLQDMGLKGIRYLDAGSRNDTDGDPTHNYVMFHHDPVQVVDKYEYGGTVDDDPAPVIQNPMSIFPKPQRMFPEDQRPKGGQYISAHNKADVTGHKAEAATIGIGPNGKPFFQASQNAVDQTGTVGKGSATTKTNLFKQKAGWKWQDAPEGHENTETIVSVEHRGKHFYALNAHFPKGVDLARYENATSEPRLRPTTQGNVTLGPQAGSISVRGKMHPVYHHVIVKADGGAVDDAIALTRRFTKDGAGATMALKPKGK